MRVLAVMMRITATVLFCVAACHDVVEPTSESTAAATAGAITGLANKCIDVRWNATDDGTPVQLYSCNGTDAQRWTIDGDTLRANGKCLTTAGEPWSNATPLTIASCDGSDRQRFTMSGTAIRNPWGKCVDVPSGNSDDATQLIIWDCHGGANQQWHVGGGDNGGGDADLVAAQQLLAPLTLGVNIERGWAWSLPANQDEYFAYLRDVAKVTHVRMFYPWRPSREMGGGGPGNSRPNAEQIDRIFNGAQHAIDAGLTVFVDCVDVLDESEISAEVDAHVALCGEVAAQHHFDPTKFALGPVNEYAGGTNAEWNPHRARWNQILRERLPGYVLTTGGANWKASSSLYDDNAGFEVFDDLRVIYDWHHYESRDSDGWAWTEQQLAAWRDAHGGRPTLNGEAGAGYWAEPVDDTTLEYAPWAWPSHMATQFEHTAVERPTLWAVTYGNSFRYNKEGDDPHFRDGSNGDTNLLEAVRSESDKIRVRLGL
jgi:hypothetical protein